MRQVESGVVVVPDEFVEHVASRVTGCTLRISCISTTVAAEKGHRAIAASQFHATADAVVLKKHILRDADIRIVKDVLGEYRSTWYAYSTPYPLTGVRLIKRSDVEAFHHVCGLLKSKLANAIETLASQWHSIVESRRHALGEMFCAADYPAADTLGDYFSATTAIVSIDPPMWLAATLPELYQQEREKARKRVRDGIIAAEMMFAEQLSELVENLRGRLQPGPDGKPRVIRDSAIDKIKEVLQDFRHAIVSGSGSALDNIMSRAEAIMRPISPDAVRHSEAIRSHLKAKLDEVGESLSQFIITRPSRAIVVD